MNPDSYGSLPACKKLAEVLAKKGIKTETDAVHHLNAFDQVTNPPDDAPNDLRFFSRVQEEVEDVYAY